MSLKKLMIISDVHVPNHDTRAMRLVMQVLRRWQPDIFVINGDYLDCESVSSHDREWGRKYDFQAELDEANGILREFEALTSRRIFIEGNHEYRWPRFLMKNAPADNRRANTIKEMLNLGSKWEHVPYKRQTRVGKLIITHDLERAGVGAVAHAAAKMQHNVVIGHTHRMGSVFVGNAAGERHNARCFGWLGNLDTVGYKHKTLADCEWQLGFGVGYLDPKGNVFLQDVPIVNNSCVVEGVLYRA